MVGYATPKTALAQPLTKPSSPHRTRPLLPPHSPNSQTHTHRRDSAKPTNPRIAQPTTSDSEMWFGTVLAPQSLASDGSHTLGIRLRYI
ncbi:hypothetical protein M011DRAFT_344100 [Sporormia fimetaria CBS 119925]|uniref:Uncharacterized protein n=1 Tax=Sporormia fimetaria CBS 119925 TaxID=1340428 RepID=A0A6A6VGS9_9PLEO|nr:hypothetical protein M011DRAFT_344100 [Sporormia fimetaria CBS 119925]